MVRESEEREGEDDAWRVDLAPAQHRLEELFLLQHDAEEACDDDEQHDQANASDRERLDHPTRCRVTSNGRCRRGRSAGAIHPRLPLPVPRQERECQPEDEKEDDHPNSQFETRQGYDGLVLTEGSLDIGVGKRELSKGPLARVREASVRPIELVKKVAVTTGQARRRLPFGECENAGHLPAAAILWLGSGCSCS